MAIVDSLVRTLEAAYGAGGCGYYPGHAPAPEPTLIAALALGRTPPSISPPEAPWLVALELQASLGDRVRAADLAGQLLASRGLEGHWLWRWKFRLFDRQVRFDPALVGWGWTERTASWVIPTALAIVALERARGAGIVTGPEVAERVARGKNMLLDRCCPGAGWNAGNPVVYGVALRPHVDTTAIALLGLQDRTDHPKVRSSLQWLRSRVAGCRSANSLAWAVVALAALGDCEASAVRDRLAAALDPIPKEVTTIAVSALAVSGSTAFKVEAR